MRLLNSPMKLGSALNGFPLVLLLVFVVGSIGACKVGLIVSRLLWLSAKGASRYLALSRKSKKRLVYSK